MVMVMLMMSCGDGDGGCGDNDTPLLKMMPMVILWVITVVIVSGATMMMVTMM